MKNGEKRYSFKGLQAFEAVARHQSISRAATELGVTQSAVSHQLRRLTQEVGEQLVAKSGRSIKLTETGRQLAETLRHAFAQINASVEKVVGVNRDNVRLAICSSFAPGWLIGRLGSFHERHPGIDLQLLMYAQDPELTDGVADAFVTSFPRRTGYAPLKLKQELLVPVYRSESDAAPLQLITTDIAPAALGADWIKYCTLTGLAFHDLHSGQWLQCSHYVLALDMARQGLGVALVPHFLARDDLEAGRLKLLHDRAMPTNEDYYLCIKSSRVNEPALKALRDWFAAQLTD